MVYVLVLFFLLVKNVHKFIYKFICNYYIKDIKNKIINLLKIYFNIYFIYTYV